MADLRDRSQRYRGSSSHRNQNGNSNNRGGGRGGYSNRGGRGNDNRFGRRGGYAGNRGGGGGRGGYVDCIDKQCDLVGHKQVVRVVTLVTEPSGRQVIYSAGQDRTVRVWDVSLPRNKQCTNCVNVEDDVGSLLVASGWLFVGIPGKIKCWNMSDNSQSDLVGHQGQVHCLAPYTEQGIIFSGGADGTIRAWRFNQQTSTFDPVGNMLGHTGAVLQLQIVGTLLFSGAMDGTIRVWDLNSAQCVFTCQAHNMPVMGILVWENHLLSASLDGTVKVWTWNAPGGPLDLTFTHTIDQSNPAGVLAMCGALDANQKPVLITSCNDGTVRFFELPTFESKGVLRQRNDVRSVGSGNGNFYFGHNDGLVRVWKWK